MGLFDGYQFDQGSYGSNGGGLIDRLLSQLQTQGQYQPSPGAGRTFDNATFDPATYAPNQAQPIAVGSNYQMPRIGNAQQFTPDPAAIPQNAQPVQGQMQMAQPQQPPLPSILQQPGNGLLDHLNAGFQNFAGGNGLISGLINGATGLATGQRLDPMGQRQEILRSQYQSLIPILGEAKARLAVLNPEMGKAMVAQALAGKQYAFTTAPDGTVIRTDAHAGTAEPVYQAGLKPTFGVIGEQDGQKTYGWIDPSKRTATPIAPVEERAGTVSGPDGKPIPIPPGVDRKTFVNEVSRANAKAAAGEKTEVQAKAEMFANKMELAEKNLKGLDDKYTGIEGGYMRGTEYVPGGNVAQSTGYQKYKQARDNFITALLRQESGAAISRTEFDRYEKELFPQPGDGAAIVTQKREARRVAIDAMKKGAGPGYKSPTFATEGPKADPLGIR